MRSVAFAAAALALAGPAFGANPPITPCSVNLRVIDQDPNGLNVRAQPDGAILTALKAKGREVDVNVTGAAGAWAEIRQATLVTHDAAGDLTTLFNGHGFVAFSKVSILGSVARESPILAEPVEGARQLFAYHLSPSHTPPFEVLGCSGAFVKLRLGGRIGWTDEII